MFPWYYVIYLTLCSQLFGADTEVLLQIPTSLYVEDTKPQSQLPDNLEQLIGRTILDVQYQFWCNVHQKKIQQPTTKVTEPDTELVKGQTGLIAIHLISTCNNTNGTSETTSGSALLPVNTALNTIVCLRSLFDDDECSNVSLPVGYARLWDTLASLLWNNTEVNMTDASFVTLISPEITLTAATMELNITVSDPSLYSTNEAEWQFSMAKVFYEARNKCVISCSKDLEPDGRVIYFNGTSLDATSPLITGSYWRCELRVTFYLRDQDVALILNVIKDQHVWTQRLTTANSWREYGVPIGQIDGIFKVQLQMYKIKRIPWKIGKVQSAMFHNCHLPPEQSDKPDPGLSVDTFVCRTGVSIRSNQLCDFRDDCFHGDDESEEICGSGFSLGLCDFEEKNNCSLLFSDYGISISTVKWVNTTSALTDYTGSLKGHILAFEEHEFSKRTGFVTVNFTNPGSSLAYNKSCEFQVDAYSSGKLFRLVVEIIDAQTEDKLNRDDTNLGVNVWQRYQLVIPDFSQRNVSSFYLNVFAVLSVKEFLGFDNIYLSPECIAKDTPDTSPGEIPEENSVVIIVTVSCAAAAVVWITVLLLMYTRYTKIPKSGKAGKSLLFGSRKRSLRCVPDSAPLLRRLNENMWQDHPNFLMYQQILTQDLSEDIKNLSRYKLKLTKVLGSGAFGEVLQGQLIKGAIYRHVAVKRLSCWCSEKERTDFLVEALTMSKFKHDNIVCCLGIYVKNGSLLLVEELMTGGDLKQFLVESRPAADETPALSTDDLLSLANDICNACSYLEIHKFIHRDIASRNCLLTTKTPDRVAKMADFGLARDIMQNDYYKKSGRSMLPVRWLPPESYLEGVFTTKSDVWAYGVLLWEIFSFGYDPYPAMKCEEMMAKVNGGQRMDAPPRCPTVIYDVMQLCWQHDPESRPSFQRLCEYLQKIRKNVCTSIVGGVDVSGDENENDRPNSYDDENKLPICQYNGHYAVEEEESV